MPRRAQHALRWSAEHHTYALYTREQLVQQIGPDDDAAWLAWLAAQTSVAFQGRCGRLNLHNEARDRGARYWYAYQVAHRRTVKRYLGATATLTLAHLENVAADLTRRHGAPARSAVLPSLPGAAPPRGAAPDVEPTPLVLRATVAPPRTPRTLVRRDRVEQQLAAVLDHRLTLISAAAGWGKTTLVSAWAHQHPGQVAWASLDRLDREPARFWELLVAALRTCAPGVGAHALAMLRAQPPAPLPAVLTALLTDFESRTAPLVLVLDDVHLVDGPSVHDGIAFLVDHLPESLHLVLITRADPALPLARWRVAGHLVEIGSAELRFTPAEAQELLRQLIGRALTDDVVQHVDEQTQGWAAGVQLAALALRQHGNAAAFAEQFSGSHQHLLDYVHEEILGPQPLAVQRFLLHTAVLPRMNAALCTALTDEPASQAILEHLERHNLFVASLDAQGQWYRVHDVVRDVLLARMEATEPALLPQLHRRAAQWYAAQGAVREAIDHALAAGDAALAAELIARAAPQLWLHGEAQTVHRWIAALPDAVLGQQATLALDAALQLLDSVRTATGTVYQRAQTELLPILARLEALLGPHVPAHDAALVRRRIGLLRALLASRSLLARADSDGLQALVQQAEELATGEQPRWTVVALALAYWHTESLQRDGGLLLPKLQHAKQHAIDAGDQLARARIVRWLVLAYGRAGQTQLAYEEALEALALADHLSADSATVGYVRYILASCYLEWNQLAEAEHELQQTLRIAHTWHEASLLVAAYALAVEVAIARGDGAAAQEALAEAEYLVRQERVITLTHAPWVLAAQVRYWLATGDLAAAGGWAAQVRFPRETWDRNRTAEYLMLVRVYLAQQRGGAALEALHRCRAQLDRPGDGATTMAYHALHAAALYGSGQPAQARTCLSRLLAMTEPSGMLRVYVDAGDFMHHLLREVRTTMDQHDAGRGPASAAYLDAILAAFGPTTPSAPDGRPAPVTALREPLTRREHEVLQLLAGGASNAAIAAQLVISLATAKKHVSNLLGKLEVESRAQAIARAHQLSLI